MVLFLAVLFVTISSGCATLSKPAVPDNSAPSPKITASNEKQSVKTAVNIPVLMYHSVAEEKDNDAVISPELFQQQMAYLHQHQYYTATLDELYDHLTGKKLLPEKTVVLTFDDGYKDTYDIVMPLLMRYGFKSTVFIPTADIGKNVTEKQLQEMKKAGMEIASHSEHHQDMGPLPYQVQVNEVVHSKQKLDQLLQQDTRYFCYPNGSYTEDTLKILAQQGFKMAFTIDPGWVAPKDNFFLVKRVWMGNSIDLRHFEERITTEKYSIL